MALSKRQKPISHIRVTFGTIAIANILQLSSFPHPVHAEVMSTVDNSGVKSHKTSVCPNSLSPKSIDQFDYSQEFSVPTRQSIKLASAQTNGVFSGFQTATYKKKKIQNPIGGNVVWCKPCPYYPAPNGCWAFIGDCQ